MTTTRVPRPDLADHFVPATLVGLARRRHPYDFVDTYRVLRRVYGYQLDYVNLGLWDDGDATVEPGRRLALRVLEELALSPGARLIDAGSGMGQAAIDACEHYQLAAVLGVNPNRRQVGYANALARSAGLGDRVRHEVADACARLAAEPAGSSDGVVAIECVGHFSDPHAFLRGAAHSLRAGGRLGLCLNVAAAPLRRAQRVAARLSYGFVPDPLARWIERLERAGFVDIRSEDLTARVLEPVTRIVRARLEAAAEVSRLTRWVMERQLAATSSAVDAGQLRYVVVGARRP